MTEPVDTSAPIDIYPGMKVEVAKEHGAEGQRLTAQIFDADSDGKYNENEAKTFNTYRIHSYPEEGTIRMVLGEKGARILELKYDNAEEDIKGWIYDDSARFGFKKHDVNNANNANNVNNANKGEDCSLAFEGNFGAVEINMVEGTATIKGDNKEAAFIKAKNLDLTITNSDLSEVEAKGGKLELNNVRNEGLVFTGKTEVKLDGKTVLHSNDSKLSFPEE